MAVYEVGKYISGTNNIKSSGPDEISNQLLKLASPYIAGSLTYIFKLRIEQNVFPSEFQKAKVIPLAKIRDLKNLNDYRPISLLFCLNFWKDMFINTCHLFSIHFNQASTVSTFAIPHLHG